MHILAGESALRALRAARHREAIVALPEVPVRCEPALVPGQHIDASLRRASLRAEGVHRSFPGRETLVDVGFDFEQVETNAHVDLWKLGDLGRFTPDRPLTLGSFDDAHRARRKKLVTLSLSRTLPADAVIQVSPLLYFVCPEVIVLQMASKLEVLQLAQLVMELCGSYSLAPDPESHERARFQIPPVTSIERIRAFAKLRRPYGGVATLRGALEIAMEGSASPGETSLSLIMSLPPDMGGYGFGKPTLNAELTPPHDLRPRVAGDVYYLDAFWQDAYADLEYESTDFHLDPLVAERLVAAKDRDPRADSEAVVWYRGLISKADADRRRLRDIQFMGIEVVPVTAFDLQDVRRMDQVACCLARRYGKRLPMGFDEWSSRLDERAYEDRRQDALRILAGTTGD